MEQKPTYEELLHRVKLLENELSNSSTCNKLSNFFKSSPMGVHTYELMPDNTLVFNGFNNSANKLLGTDHAQFIGKTIEQAFPNLATTEIPNIYRDIALNGTNWNTEQVIYDDGNISGAFEVHAFQISPMNTGVLFLEISERKRIEKQLLDNEALLRHQNNEYQTLNEEYLTQNEELNSTLEELQALNEELIFARNKAEESDKLKSAFLANMSHEIRTPMNGIVGFAELLRNTEIPPDKIVKYIDIINNSSQQLLNIINDIIDISKIEAGLITFKDDSFNIKVLLEEINNLFEPTAQKKNITIINKTEISDNEANIISDQCRLRQILSNLVSNAIKFTSNGTVTISSKIKNNKLVFSISDTGIGIESDNLNLIFERFRQVDNSNSRKYGGTGLGLSISKSLAEMLGGSLWVESSYGIGSTFNFSINYTTQIKEETTEPLKTIQKYNWSNKSILLVEDEETNLFYLHELINNKGATIYTAYNGIEAINVVKNKEIDLILMDLKMPEMDGFEATKIIKQSHPKIPIIAQTAYAMSNDREKAIQAGCTDYISKPIDRSLLYQLINSLLFPKLTN